MAQHIGPGTAALGLAAALLGMAGISAPGCSVLCTEDRRVVEVEFGSPLYELQQTVLRTYRSDGYECNSEGSIRDGFGRTIGTRYACTKCD